MTTADLAGLALVMAAFAITLAISGFVYRLSDRAVERPILPIGEIFGWSSNLQVSVEALKQYYGWRVEFWISTGNAALAAIGALLAGVLLESWKTGAVRPHWLLVLGTAAAGAALLGVYIICQRTAGRLGEEFLATYAVLRFVGALI